MSGTLAIPSLHEGDSFAAYVHVPFCAARCGYCDFNTYTNLDFGDGASVGSFASTLCAEIDMAARALSLDHGSDCRSDCGSDCGDLDRGELQPLTSVFFGGGTPSMLPAAHLVSVLAHLRSTFGIVAGAEITTEANPESVTPGMLDELRDGGFTRISFGMQSAVERVLSTLERRHTPGQVAAVTRAARERGFQYSVDLIYGTPGETMSDWETSLRAAIALEPHHISAYALTIEPYTPMGRAIARGDIPEPDPDDQADKYERAEELLHKAGYRWYEISNWAQPGYESRHNITYWKEGNWWGFGPGAHSHIHGTRWWNVKHPIAYAGAQSAERRLPVADFETLSAEEIREERILMGIRLSEGIEIPRGTRSSVLAELLHDGLIERAAYDRGRVCLTLRGRLLADVVTRALW